MKLVWNMEMDRPHTWHRNNNTKIALTQAPGGKTKVKLAGRSVEVEN